jgi:hypothetical protein
VPVPVLSFRAEPNRYLIFVDGSFHLALIFTSLLQNKALRFFNICLHFPASDFIQVFQQKQRDSRTAVICDPTSASTICVPSTPR